MGMSKSSVHRILAQARLQPHRLERYMASNDPDFEEKAADIIGLYLEPPQHAAVFCVDEKTAIQALDRLDPVLPLSPGRAERHGFEYYRHGTLSLYAALDVKTGKVQGKTAHRHTSDEFVAFLADLVKRARWAKEIHIVLDNLSAHKTKSGSTVPRRAPQSTFPFHSDLLLLAQPSGVVVRQDPARPTSTGHPYLGRRSDQSQAFLPFAVNYYSLF
jgi:transposase